jgi:hypothetical protein
MSTETDQQKAKERVCIAEQITSSAERLNGLLELCSKGSQDREELKLANGALLFALVRLDEFIEFQAQIKRQDSN